MAVPFGFSIGDCLAIFKLIYQVSRELKSNGSASPEYQETIITLESLNAALTQLFDLKPSANEQVKIDALRAVAMTCKLPLQEFQDKISSFESSLGPWRTGTSQKMLCKKLQWTWKYSKDLAILRSKLSTHVATINLLMLTQTFVSIQALDRQQTNGAASVLETLTNLDVSVKRVEKSRAQIEAELEAQTRELSRINQNTQSQSAMIDTLIFNTASVSSNQEAVLSRVDDVNYKLFDVVSEIADFKDAAADLDTKADKTLSFLVRIMRQLLRGAIQVKAIAVKLNELCSLILQFNNNMLQIMTTLLFVCHVRVCTANNRRKTFDQVRSMLSRLEHFLPMQIYLPIVKFRDPFGYQMAFPYELSRQWQTFRGMLEVAFIGKQGAWRIERGLYSISIARLDMALNPIYWENAIRENDELTMSIIIPELSNDDLSCPWTSCQASLEMRERTTHGIDCPQCHRWITKPVIQNINHRTKPQIGQKVPAFTGAVISAAIDDMQQVVTLSGKEQCLDLGPSNYDGGGGGGVRSEDFELYRSVRIPTEDLDACGLLKAGARFYGTQRSGRRLIYKITVVIIAVVIPYGYISGFVTSSAPNDTYPPVTTYFEGEIVDGINHKFKTPETYDWSGTTRTDLTQWSRLPPFKPLMHEFRRDSNFPKYSSYWKKTSSRHVFMRWKEQRLSDSRIREVKGATFDGFYYICCNQREGKIDGIYYDARKKKHHVLELTAEARLERS